MEEHRENMDAFELNPYEAIYRNMNFQIADDVTR